MAKDPVYVTRRRILASVATVGGASAASGAGTMAFFSDTETSSENTIQTGTLNLTLDGDDETVEFLTEENVAPGDTGSSTLELVNTGSLTGYVDVEVTSVENYENGRQGNERSVDDSGGDPGQGNGELQNHLEVSADLGGEELWPGSALATNAISEGNVYDLDYELGSEASATFELGWELPTDTGREAQSDSLTFALTFTLDQQTDSGA